MILESAHRRIVVSANMPDRDKEILMMSRVVIARSLRILRESDPENRLGRNYYERQTLAPEG